MSAGPFTFYLGTHLIQWVWDPKFQDIPLFLSRRILAGRKKLKRAVTTYAVDSGGFTELQIYGRWQVSPEQYVNELRRFRDQMGPMQFAAPQDWMCEKPVLQGLVEKRKRRPCPECKRQSRKDPAGEVVYLRVRALDVDERPTFECESCGHTEVGKPPQIHVGRWRSWAQAMPRMRASMEKADALGMEALVVFHGTGLTVEDHQRRTVENFVTLRRLAPDLPIMPVLQGWTLADYLRCVALYEAAGVDLRAEPVVGVGTVCRRQGTAEAATIMRTLRSLGLRLHGFGFKMAGVEQVHDAMVSADSLAWSFAGRRSPPLPGHKHKNCANCMEFALRWRQQLLDRLRSKQQEEDEIFACLTADQALDTSPAGITWVRCRSTNA